MRPLALLTLLLACAPKPYMVRLRPSADRDLTGVVFLHYAASQAEAFFDAKGRPCRPFDGEVKFYFAGWQSRDDDPVCDHDTFEDGLRPAKLEFDWRGTVPDDGAWDVLSAGYRVGAWGRAQARGAYYGDFFAWVQLILEVRSPHCQGTWTTDLARSRISAPYAVARDFTGWFQIPDVRLDGCKAGDPIDVRLRLLAESNRGRIEIDAFGFSTLNDEDLNKIFGVRRASAPAAARASPR